MRLFMRVASALTLAAPLSAQAPSPASRAPTDSNIVFANVANAALLMDVYRPQRSNGRGIVFIAGSGWGGSSTYAHSYDDVPLKDDAREAGGYIGTIVQALVDAGFTVFSINHRFTPETPFPGPFYDAQRAVRFIRSHASSYGIDATRLGALGHSSGGHLAAMLGVVDTSIADAKAPAQRGSSQVQAVVTLAAPFMVTSFSERAMPLASKLIGPLPSVLADSSYPDTPAIVAASPVRRATAATAPMLIYQAQDDPIVLPKSAPLMAARLSALGVPNRLVMRAKGGHAPEYDVADVVGWFERYLK
jgi:acetyl esterase/lipase